MNHWLFPVMETLDTVAVRLVHCIDSLTHKKVQPNLTAPKVSVLPLPYTGATIYISLVWHAIHHLNARCGDAHQNGPFAISASGDIIMVLKIKTGTELEMVHYICSNKTKNCLYPSQQRQVSWLGRKEINHLPTTRTDMLLVDMIQIKNFNISLYLFNFIKFQISIIQIANDYWIKVCEVKTLALGRSTRVGIIL